MKLFYTITCVKLVCICNKQLLIDCLFNCFRRNQRKIPKTDSGPLFKKRKSEKIGSASEFDSGMKAKRRKMN